MVNGLAKNVRVGLMFASVLIWAATAKAAVIVLDFEGLGDLESVNDFYNGGTGGSGSGPGTNFGIAFTNTSLAIIDADAGGSGNFGGEPSPDTVLFFLTGSAIMNVAAGFDTGFSFFYSAISNPGSINVYDGLNGTGTLLTSLALPLTAFNGAPDPSGAFSPLVPIGIAFAGTARSVDFGGTVNQIAFDDITLGSVIPGETTTTTGDGPEPTTMTLLGAGLAAGAARRLRQRRTSRA